MPEYDDLLTLLKDLHAGVQELGVGQCDVRSKDDPKNLLLGWELSQTVDGKARWWDFTIRVTRLKRLQAVVPRTLLMNTEGRETIAALLEKGDDPETLF